MTSDQGQVNSKALTSPTSSHQILDLKIGRTTSSLDLGLKTGPTNL